MLQVETQMLDKADRGLVVEVRAFLRMLKSPLWRSGDFADSYDESARFSQEMAKLVRFEFRHRFQAG